MLKTAEDFFRCDGEIADADGGGVVDSVDNGRGHGDEWWFAQSFGAIRADRVWVFDQHGLDGRDIQEVGSFERIEIRVEGAPLSGPQNIFHERVTESLDDAADDRPRAASGWIIRPESCTAT